MKVSHESKTIIEDGHGHSVSVVSIDDSHHLTCKVNGQWVVRVTGHNLDHVFLSALTNLKLLRQIVNATSDPS